MSHELEIVNGEAQMAYVGDVPWHGLGTKVDRELTPDQFQKVAGLDWTVEKQPLVTATGIPIKNKQALIRSSDSTVLDVVGKGWNPVQNSEAFEFFHDYVMAGDMEMHTAGSLKDGQMVWALAKTKESFELFKGDQTDNYFLFTNPHQFGKSINIRMTPIRVVCNNTLTLSLSQDSDKMVTVNHRKAFDPDMVKEQMGIAKEKMEQYKSMAAFLGSKRATGDNIIQYFNEVFGAPAKEKVEGAMPFTSRNAKIAMENLTTQPGAQFAEGSWWQAFNSVTYMTDHLQGREGDSRLQSAWYGRNRKVKLNALDKALVYAEAA
jgi:phage/plasmid-like protein (TIGR03299 family)|tara:strand:+ start:568 stop:1527 length:960 start_codon:yes stop_codon:yes gene_type:complete